LIDRPAEDRDHAVPPVPVQVSSVTVHECTEECRRPQRHIRDRQHVMNELASYDSYDLHLLLDDQSWGVGSRRADQRHERVVKPNATEFRASLVCGEVAWVFG
jgi:hypothetical protein